MKMNEKLKPIIIRNAKTMYRNFSGAETKFNKAGDRNFCVVLDDLEFARKLQEEGWNVRWRQPRDEDDTEMAYLSVAVKFNRIPPQILMVTQKGKVALDESSIDKLDWLEFTNVDLIINPSKWEVSGKSGIKAYLKTLAVTIYEDELITEYSDIPDIGTSVTTGDDLVEEDTSF